MNRSTVRLAVLGVIFILIGVASTAAVLAYLPDTGTPPSVYDDFTWSTTANGFWHVNADGAKAIIKNSLLTMTGDMVELDHRLQTDPKETVVVAKVRGLKFTKFGLGIGVYHSGTVGLEFDKDGVKCGRGTDQGWTVDYIKGWKSPPVHQWYYLLLSVKNPYPSFDALQKAETYADEHETKLKPIKMVCAVYDSQQHLVGKVVPTQPPPNAHYQAFDEVFMHTWDRGNTYQVDWFYAGPPSGIPAKGLKA